MPPQENSPEYGLMLEIERLESLREQMDEAGFGSLSEIEAALQLTSGDASADSSNDLSTQRALLLEIRDELVDLDLNNYSEVNNQITALHRQLDNLEGFDPDVEQP